MAIRWADFESGLAHTVQVTAANVHDVCVTADLLTGVRKNKSMVTADILVQKNVPKPGRKIRPERKFDIKSIVVPVKVKITLPVLRHRSSGASIRNPRFAPKSNMSLRF